MFKKINSKYIIQEIFNYLDLKRVLELARYSKDIKNKLEVTKKNYEKIFNQIQIEIFPKDNLEFKANEQNIFINFLGGKNYYHIFFDDNDEEIDRNYIQKGEQIKKIKIMIEPEFNSLSGLFKDCKCIKEIRFTKFNRTDIIDMKEMFYGCHSLTKINFSHFNTENVTNMSNMFMQCSKLEALDVSTFNTYSGTIDSALTNKVDVSAYTAYTSATDTAIAAKADSTAVTQALASKVDVSAFNTYSGGVDTAL